ncbi:hypothetical protein K7X08_005851 [Anisodus acutangulus]|uniref:CCHC-type domain-containing protein n=1 Tax=Anisodus acutangulus TaxID=402998 RepID=A0A9Q1LT70_9SOLA|nr:hypothetical protein K7X08_005851 [Anisodus acutangulus]
MIAEERAKKAQKPLETSANIQPPASMEGINLEKDQGNPLAKDIENLISQLSDKMKLSPSTSKSVIGMVNTKDTGESSDNRIAAVKRGSNWTPRNASESYYYPRPTPMDVLIEEGTWKNDHTAYTGTEIVEWNIDGGAETQIYRTCHKTLMYAAAAKGNNQTELSITKMICVGFTGKLKAWWDNYLSPDQKMQITNSIPRYPGICVSYGMLISKCTEEGLALCNDIKLQRQLKKQRLTEKTQLGEFCQQFAMDESAPTQKTGKRKNHVVKPQKKEYYEKYKAAPYKKKAAKRRARNQKTGRVPKKRTTKTTTCYACGEVGHYANRCKKKKADKIKALKIDDNIKDALMKIMIPSDDSDDSDKSVTTDSEDPYSSSSGESDSYICTSSNCQKNREEDT